MTLTLRLENFELLQDGSPAWITLQENSINVGRNRAMDWVLPIRLGTSPGITLM